MNGTMVRVAPTVTTRTVGDVHAALVQALAGADAGQEVLLDVGAVEQVDLSFVQLIAAVRQHAATTGTRVQLTTPANSVITALLHRAGCLTEPAPDDIQFWFHGDIPQ